MSVCAFAAIEVCATKFATMTMRSERRWRMITADSGSGDDVEDHTENEASVWGLWLELRVWALCVWG